MRITVVLLLIAISAVNSFCGTSLTESVHFASIEKAKKLLVQEDAFTNSWSQFDIDSRMGKKQSTRAELMDFIASQALDWTQDEKNKVFSILINIDEQISNAGLHINFPDVMHFVKTTAAEEGGAGGYTRANYIVLKAEMLTKSNEPLKQTIVHELFHILTRNDPHFRKEMYGIIGFELVNAIPYPESLKDVRITNPDAPQTDSYITLQVGDEDVECMMILYADRTYDGGDFFGYLKSGFVRIQGDLVKEIALVDGQPVIYTFDQVAGFFEQVGKNTRYIIHPEEILADNFAFAVLNKSGLPNPEIVGAMIEKLKN